MLRAKPMSWAARRQRRLHRGRTQLTVNGMAVEQHEQSGGHLKSIVFGGLDGILTSFAIIAGSHGAKLSPVSMLALGVSNVLADALSMGAGEFLSSRSYNAVRHEGARARGMAELSNYPAGEIAEMVELFVARGMSREDAQVVIQRMAKYKDFFVDLMMTEELFVSRCRSRRRLVRRTRSRTVSPCSSPSPPSACFLWSASSSQA